MIRVAALYPDREDGKFDFDYYLHEHMPMVLKLLEPYGMIRYEVDRGLFAMQGKKAEFVAIGYVYAKSLDELTKGLGVHEKAILDDIPNYTNLPPTLQFSEVL